MSLSANDENKDKLKSNLLDSSSSILSPTLKNTYVLFRHGQSKANVSKIVVSSLENDSGSVNENNWGLTVLGEKQVENAVEDLLDYLLSTLSSSLSSRHNNDINYSTIYLKVFTSPFSRTIETAKIIHDRISNYPSDPELSLSSSSSPLFSLDPIVTVHHQLCERNFGIFELKPDHESYHKVWSIDENINGDDDDDEYKRLGVETCREVRKRMCNVIHEIEKGSKGNDINDNDDNNKKVFLLVSHGDPLQILQTAFENVSPNSHRKLNHLETAGWKIVNNKIN